MKLVFMLCEEENISAQSGALSLVEILQNTVLWLVEIIMLQRQLFYVMKNQLKAPKAS